MPQILGGYSGNIKVIPVISAVKRQDEVLDRFMQLLADAGITEVKRICQGGLFKNPTGALANSIQGRVEGRAVVWWSDVQYAKPQEYGVQPHAMYYLMGKTVPLTIYKFGSEIKIFRKVTLKALLAGKWFHPGYPGKFFMKKGINVAIGQIPQLLEKAQKAVIQVY